MAGEWIPVRVDLFGCPQVVQILSRVCPDCVRNKSERVRKTSEVVGALIRMWSLFDRHTDDGELHGYTTFILDDEVGIDGFAEAVASVGWLLIEANSLKMPEFSKYLSTSAKTRMKDAQRKREQRAASEKCPENVQNDSDKKRTTEEKRIEEKRIEDKKEELNTSCSEPQAASKPKPSDEPLYDLEFKTTGKQRIWKPPQSLVDKLIQMYDTLDVPFQLRAASMWCETNDRKRKTPQRMGAFLTNWLNKAVERQSQNGAFPPGKSTKNTKPNLPPIVGREMTFDEFIERF